MSRLNVGAGNPNYTGVPWISSVNGYVCINKNGNVRHVHRLIMEEHLGRKLETREHVHHRNGNRADNRLENLEVVDASEHKRMHWNDPDWRNRTLRAQHSGRVQSPYMRNVTA